MEHMRKSLQSTDIDQIYEIARIGIDRGTINPELVTHSILKNQTGTTVDEAVLLIHRAKLRSKEVDILNRMRVTSDKKELFTLQEELNHTYAQMSDNDMAAAMIGREASSIFRLRKRYVDSELSLSQMEREYMATKNLDSLTPEEQAFVKNKFQSLREARAKILDLESKQGTKVIREKIMSTLKTEGKSKGGPKDIISDAKDRLRALKASMGTKFSAEEVGDNESLMWSASEDPKAEMSRAIADIAKFYAKSEKTLDGIVTKTLKEVKEIYPDFTSRDIMEHLTGYAKNNEPKTKSELQTVLSDAKREARLRLQLEDLEAGKEVQKRKVTKRPDTQEIKDLKDKIKNKKAENKSGGLSKDELSELKKQERLLNTLEDLNNGIEPTKKFTPRKEDSPEVKSIKEEIKIKAKELGITEREYNRRRISYLKNREAFVQEQIDNGQFTSLKKAAEVYEKSDELLNAERDYKLKVNEWKTERAADLKKNRPFIQKVADNILRWQRAAVLSYPSTIVKLVAVVAHSLILKPYMTAWQQLINMFTPRGVSSKADLWGKVHWEAVADYYTSVFQNFSLNNLKQQFKGKDEHEIQYGNPKIYEEWTLARGILEMPGRSHGWIKSFIKNAEFAYAMKQITLNSLEHTRRIGYRLEMGNISPEQRTELEKEFRNYDITKPDVQLRIGQMAVEHGKWSILMNENNVVGATRSWMEHTGILGAFAKSELPILRIPSNYIDRALTFKYGLIVALAGKRKLWGDYSLQAPGAISLLWNGTQNLKRDEADVIQRSVILGSMGASLFALGALVLYKYLTHNPDGSYTYNDGTHSQHILKNTIHVAPYESILNGVNSRHKLDQMIASGDTLSALDWVREYVNQDIQLITQSPFFNMMTYGFTGKMMQLMTTKDTSEIVKHKIATAVTQKLVDMVDPGWVKEYAKYHADSAGDVRIPHSPKEVIWAAWPWTREWVPTKDSLEMAKRQKALDKSMMGTTPEEEVKKAEKAAEKKKVRDSLEILMEGRLNKHGQEYIPPKNP